MMTRYLVFDEFTRVGLLSSLCKREKDAFPMRNHLHKKGQNFTPCPFIMDGENLF